jgi:hypothetical protein
MAACLQHPRKNMLQTVASQISSKSSSQPPTPLAPPPSCCRQQDCKLPELSGITVGQIDAWWAGNRERAATLLTEFASEVITTVAALAKADQSSVLVSAKEVSQGVQGSAGQCRA